MKLMPSQLADSFCWCSDSLLPESLSHEGLRTEKLNMLSLFSKHKYVVINYCMASAAESKHPEYSGRMTHQTGAVQGAA